MLDLELLLLENEEITGFELGYISFYTVDEENVLKYENQPVMIFLTISELLLGIVDFVKNELLYKEIISVDSSLTFILRRCNKKKDKYLTELYVNKVLIAKVTDIFLLKLVYNKSFEFCNMHLKMHITKNSVVADLSNAFICVQEILS